MGSWRLFLAWCVVAVHTPGFQDRFQIDIGIVAVAAFFFISGFLMPLVYETRYQTARFHIGCMKFFLNRFLRIFPIYWISCLVVIGTTMVSVSLHSQEGRVLPPEFSEAITYIQNFLLIGLNQASLWGGYFRFNNPAWTLDVELQYYLLVPFICLAVNRFPKRSGTGLVIALLVSVGLLIHPTEIVDIDRSLLAWAVFFVLGFAYYRSESLQNRFNLRSMLLAQSLLFGVVLFSSTRSMDTILLVVGFVLVSAYLLVLQRKNKFGRVDSRIGDLSYPVYILHLTVLGPAARLMSFPALSAIGDDMRFALALALNILISTVAGYIVLRWVAEPIDRIRSRIRQSGEEKGGKLACGTPE
jgi:peptidoglycan/LPS O-acetylase OafA/YrhL